MKTASTALNTTLGTLLLCSTLTAGSALAADPSLKTEQEKLSYAIGFQVGQSFKNEGLEIDSKTLAQAIDDVLKGNELKLSMDEMRDVVETFRAKQAAERAARADKALEEGKTFLAANKEKPGIKALPSGVQYKVITAGSGKQPKTTDSISAHYRGTLLNGEEFDSSYKRGQPATFGVNQVIKGWQEILPMMHEGAKWQVFIPAEMAYGAQGAGGNIGPNETLIFEIELIKVIEPDSQ